MQQALRIFAHASIGSTLPRPRRGVLVTPLTLVPEEPDDTIADEPRILDILTSAPEPGETIDAAYKRKERELAEAFTALARTDAAALYKRFTEPHAGDELARRFARLVIDRRTRLLAILADAPRREARAKR